MPHIFPNKHSMLHLKTQGLEAGPPAQSDDHSSHTLIMARAEEEHEINQQSMKIPSDIDIVDWNGPNDPDNPFCWSVTRKWIITIAALFATFTVLLNGTIITVAHAAINQDFGVSDATFPNSYWPVASWTLGGALSMMTILPLMEDFGIRWPFLATYFIFILFIIPQAVAQNFATLIITRFFAGACVSILANTTGAIICDIWEGDVGRTIPMSLFVTTYLVGSTLGPVIGGAIFEFLSWRWIGYIQLIYYGVFFPIYCVVIRETRGPVILRRRAKKIRKETGSKSYTREELDNTSLLEILTTSIKRPMYMLCTEYVVFSFTCWSAFSVGTVYLFTQSVEQVFAGLYGWNASQAGYVQGAVVIGEILGLLGSLVSSRLYFASASRNKENPGEPIPEARLYVSIFAGFVGVTGGMFVYAWTAYPYLPWIAPAIGMAMVGFGINVIVIAIADYLTDCYSMFAASAIGVVGFGENVLSAFLPLSAQSMYTKLGFHWASTLLAFLGMLLACAPVVLLIWGRKIRANSPFINQAQYVKKAVDTEESVEKM